MTAGCTCATWKSMFHPFLFFVFFIFFSFSLVLFSFSMALLFNFFFFLLCQRLSYHCPSPRFFFFLVLCKCLSLAPPPVSTTSLSFSFVTRLLDASIHRAACLDAPKPRLSFVISAATWTVSHGPRFAAGGTWWRTSHCPPRRAKALQQPFASSG